MGLSPPVRGNPGIPRSSSVCAVVYPRPCGETNVSRRNVSSATGLSPPVRGNRGNSRFNLGAQGSIPARAGKPWTAPEEAANERVYPRPCGETLHKLVTRAPDRGLSPPVRGNQVAVRGKVGSNRSIPARAGKPQAWGIAGILLRVYPRPCGETRAVIPHGRLHEGLSPPVRGNL